jgi:hypothetical protein
LVAAATLVVLASAAPAAAQVDEAPPTDATFTMDVQVGIAGYAHPDQPLPVVVDLSSEELIVGRLEVNSGGAIVHADVEVPAGSVKQYVIQGEAPGSRRQVTVSLIQVTGGDEDVLEQQSLRVELPSSEILVGLLGVQGIEVDLRSAGSTPLAREIVPLQVSAPSVAGGGGPLGYLVLGAGADADLDPEALSYLTAWVQDGGRLVGPPGTLDAFAEVGGGAALEGAPALVTRLGLGELVAVADPEALTAADWSAVIRDLPPLGLVRRQIEGQIGDTASLVAAATAGREATVPALPWLLLGILLFVVLVGPVNFLVLRRFARPELAWVTVPVLSAVFVGAFWIVGRSQLQDFTLTQAAVVVDNGLAARASGAVVLQTEAGGEHELALPATWRSAPTSGTFGLQTGVARGNGEGGVSVAFELEDLGVGVTQAQWDEDPIGVTVDLTASERELAIAVTNGSSLDFWAWGVVVDGVAIASDQPLPPDGSGTLTGRTVGLGRSSGFEPIMSAAVQRKLFYDERFQNVDFQVLEALAAVGQQEAPLLRRSGLFFFGFTDDPEPVMAVDGRSGRATGTTLVVKRMAMTQDTLVAFGASRPEVLAITGASSVEEYDGRVWAYGAEEIVLRYLIPAGVGAGIRIDPGSTQLREVEVFDWDAGDFVSVAWADDLTRYLSAAGELVVRSRPENDRFFDEGLVLSRFAASWGSA